MWGQPLLALSAKNGFIGMLLLLMWQQIGYVMIIYVAGLNNVSPDLIEAAQIDGATSRQILFKIKIPMIMPSVTICTFLTLTNGFKMFDQNLSLTGGAPGKQSQLLALNIYDTFYARSGPMWKGIGQAKAVVFFILVVAIAPQSNIIQVLMENKKKNPVATKSSLSHCSDSFNSLKKESAITTSTVFSIPNKETWNGLSNFVASVTQMDFLKSFWYSLVISVMSVVLILLCCSMCAWYIVRVNGKLSKLFYYLCVFSMVVPFRCQ